MALHVIYTIEGKPIYTVNGEIGGYVEVEEPEEGYYLAGIDLETGEAIYAEEEKTADERLAELEQQLADADAMNVDQEYRLTLMELGIDETETE